MPASLTRDTTPEEAFQTIDTALVTGERFEPFSFTSLPKNVSVNSLTPPEPFAWLVWLFELASPDITAFLTQGINQINAYKQSPNNVTIEGKTYEVFISTTRQSSLFYGVTFTIQ